jgi:hypothetical protein
MKKVTVCVLTYGDYPDLAKRCINSIIDKCPRAMYELRVGCNSVSLETLAYVTGLCHEGLIDCLYVSHDNINKSPMMRRMYKDVNTEFIWWFDDDSYIKQDDAMEKWLDRAEADSAAAKPPALYGKVFFFGDSSAFDYGLNIKDWISKQRWFRDKPIPCGVDKYDPGFNKDGKDTRYFFVTGGVHLIRTDFVEMLGWPTPTLVKRNDDVILCCAIRQNEYSFVDIDYGVGINEHDRRGGGEDENTMKKQLEG